MFTPNYTCHKEVFAFKIGRIEGGTLIDAEGIHEEVTMTSEYLEKHKPEVGGYYVKYPDGYESFSPSKAFEDGYSLLELRKTFSNTDANGAKKNVKDIKFWGDGDTFQLISKASSENEGWMKSTKAMKAGNGVVVQVTTQQRNADLSYSVAEALTFVPNSTIQHCADANGVVVSRVIVPIGEPTEATALGE